MSRAALQRKGSQVDPPVVDVGHRAGVVAAQVQRLKLAAALELALVDGEQALRIFFGELDADELLQQGTQRLGCHCELLASSHRYERPNRVDRLVNGHHAGEDREYL